MRLQLKNSEKDNAAGEILHALHYTNIEEAGYEMMLLSAQSNYAEYLSETRKFEQKYRRSFEEFREKMETTLYEEDFENEDDYMDWKFAQDGVRYWKEKIAEMKDCGAPGELFYY